MLQQYYTHQHGQHDRYTYIQSTAWKLALRNPPKRPWQHLLRYGPTRQSTFHEKYLQKKIILFPQKIFSLPMWTWRCDLRRIYLVQHMRFCIHFGKTKNFLCFDYPHEIALALRIPYAWMRITWSQSRRQGWWKKKQKHTFAHDPICGITSEVFSMVDMSITRTQHSKQIRSFFSFLASVLLCVWKKQLIFLRVLLTRVRIHTHFLHCEKFSINVA